MDDEFISWLATELNRRGLSHAKLASQAGVSRAAVSNTLRGVLPVSCDFCIKIARALDVAPEYVLRLAGILPGEPAQTTPGPITVEIMAIVESLPPDKRRFALELMRLAATLPPDKQKQVLDYVRFLRQS